MSDVTAFKLEMALPVTERAPVEWAELRRLAAIFLSDAIKSL